MTTETTRTQPKNGAYSAATHRILESSSVSWCWPAAQIKAGQALVQHPQSKPSDHEIGLDVSARVMRET